MSGARVAHVADELHGGGTMVLTLADEQILDEKGQLRDGGDLKLENVGLVRLACVASAYCEWFFAVGRLVLLVSYAVAALVLCCC